MLRDLEKIFRSSRFMYSEKSNASIELVSFQRITCFLQEGFGLCFERNEI